MDRADHSTARQTKRRRLLQGGLVTALTSVSALSSAEKLVVPPWVTSQGKPIVDGSYGNPAPQEILGRTRFAGSLTDTAAASLTPLHKLHGIITPSGLVFERHHAGVPQISPDVHRLVIHGRVKRPLSFSMEDLMRFPSVSRIHFLECSGNTLQEWKGTPGKTAQETHGLLSCCEWTGVPLNILLEEAGVDPDADWLLAEGADAAAMTRSVPVEKAMDDALVVYAQNGEALRPEQGYPVRLFLPGYEGNMSVKWLRRIKVGLRPFMTREETSKYTDLMPNGKSRMFSFLMEAKSVILSPSGGQHLKAKGPQAINGIAWSGRGKIRKVEVSTDAGKTWHDAKLETPVMNRCLTRFHYTWNWDGSPAVVQSRATDESGYVQPTRDELVAVRGVHSHYHFNGIQGWKISESGEVINAHA